MIKPYLKQDCEEYTLYEFKTLYMYIFFLLIAIMISGNFINAPYISIAGAIGTAIYYFIVYSKYIKLYKKIKKAKKSGLLELTGNKMSFSNPLKAKIFKSDL